VTAFGTASRIWPRPGRCSIRRANGGAFGPFDGEETIQVELTATAARQVRDLRGRRRKAALAALVELRDPGCSAAGYCLTGARLDYVSARHLCSEDRMLIACRPSITPWWWRGAATTARVRRRGAPWREHGADAVNPG
jgi:hypothetical protein